jgi:predicted GNAT family acetyltransferase
MDLRVTAYDNPATALEIARGFLESEPVRHNLVLSLLHARLSHPEPGRYWIAEDAGRIAGVVFQSPSKLAAVITPMAPAIAAAMADAIACEGTMLPGVSGEAASAASFAGQWTERTRTAAFPIDGTRLYEVDRVLDLPAIDGHLRPAEEADRSLLIDWVGGFQAEIRENAYDPEYLVDRWLGLRLLWLWDNGRAVSMAGTRESVAGVVRIGGVYTPPEYRRQGAAAACVHALSRSIRGQGCRCILYTDLGNAGSNSMYRRIGYRAIAEGIRYRFEAAPVRL